MDFLTERWDEASWSAKSTPFMPSLYSITHIGFLMGFPFRSCFPMSSIESVCIVDSMQTSFWSFQTKASRPLSEERKSTSPFYSFRLRKSLGMFLRFFLTVPTTLVLLLWSSWNKNGLLNQLSRNMVYPLPRRSAFKSSTIFVLAGVSVLSCPV